MSGTPRAGARVVALGGGHGLAATLQALRRVTDDITAIVGVSDDGGSSGRLRREFGVIPPGDLRMALAALCGDDAWGRTWARVVQHRFGGDGELSGHALGNLLIAGLWEHTEDIVTGLAWVAELLDAHGRVLPLANQPLDIVAEVMGLNGNDPAAVTEVRGQVSVARTRGTVQRVRLEPADVEPCAESLAAIAEADAIIMGPGSWYTSVLPHLLLPRMREAIARSRAKRICVLNLAPQAGETMNFELHTHLDVLHAFAPELGFDVVLADRAVV
ncbi:MAG: gluconeogenesis factor YvcK family protein, partial [Candidatus Nanopelagicales bacterium]